MTIDIATLPPYEITLYDEAHGGPLLKRYLRPLAFNARVGGYLFDMLGDHQLIEACARQMARLLPPGTEVVFGPQGKADALITAVGREAGLPVVIARKTNKPYLLQPVMEQEVSSMTSGSGQCLYLGADAVAVLAGKKVVFVDDVVSTGDSLQACRQMVKRAGGALKGAVCAFTEGPEPRTDSTLWSLGNLPTYKL